MKQLGTLDSAFVNLENAATPQHVGGLGIYDPASAPGGFVRFKDVLSNFDNRLSKLPLFRTRLVEVPGGLDRPYWVEDEHYDVEFHIRHIALPRPGDWRQLWIQVARLHSRPIDMKRPLWEVYVIEGLDNIEGIPEGAFAIYTKMHHSLIDGAGGATFMSALHDFEADPAFDQLDKSNTIIRDRQPSQAELLARSALNLFTGSVRNMRSIGSTVSDLAKYGLAIGKKELQAPDINAPKTRFNGKVGPHRVAEALMLELKHIKEIKNATGSTVNDVCLAIVSGGIRNYLEQKGELPEDSLMAGIPLNMRTRTAETDEKNQVGSTFSSIHSDIEDPLERIAAIAASTKVAKEDALKNPMVNMLRVSGFMVPAVTKPLARIWARNELSRFLPVGVSTVVTNVPGPNFPLYCAGAEMVRYYGLGLLTPSCGLFHAIFSSNGKVTLTVLADRNMMPDPEVYKQCLQDAFDEMYAAAVGSRKKANAKRSKRATATEASA
ncbi:MAG: wax ester/triacylglycerol synthase family O-acyltransferase [Gammaproteobacteria bacterium]|nr:wax ester/triacylglycerol synthase family O-acyltransferase [Gammaproteobacteria bacterium]NND39318.1 wax ester/triacylglycerol synthase family O-acyltransferase [Pseudomonadales bacterium]NNL11975.1 wax ester/triacylglycerol synthase family O-acyltransferase [Pseudomonadales bacterium]NNM11654.1 wax ester/triacylglycerol synthase family O-acyltransferase [Pseudomonadales bacterium]